MKEFLTAKMDNRTLVSTIIFFVICIISCAFLFIKLFRTQEYGVLFPIVILIAAIGISYLLIPKLFIDGEQNIIIKNTFADITIKKNEIKKIEIYTTLKFNFRTFGVGGVFGNFGYFNGNDVWYVTNIHKKIRIETYKKIYMISPENPDEFLNYFEKVLNDKLQ